jgi:hypothetical protein
MNLIRKAFALLMTVATTGASAEPAYLRCKNLDLPPDDVSYITLAVDLATSSASLTAHFPASIAGPAGARTVQFQVQRSDERSITATATNGTSFTLDRLSGQTLLSQVGAGKRIDSSLACQPTKPVL